MLRSSANEIRRPYLETAMSQKSAAPIYHDPTRCVCSWCIDFNSRAKFWRNQAAQLRREIRPQLPESERGVCRILCQDSGAPDGKLWPGNHFSGVAFEFVKRPCDSAGGRKPYERPDNDGYDYDSSCGFHALVAALWFTLLVTAGGNNLKRVHHSLPRVVSKWRHTPVRHRSPFGRVNGRHSEARGPAIRLSVPTT